MRIVFVVGVILACLIGAGWRLFQPSVKLASEAEIRAVLPKELLEEIPEDPQAVARYKKLSALSASLKKDDVDKLLNPQPYAKSDGTGKSKLSIPQFLALQYKETKRFWSVNPSFCSDLKTLVDSGPFEAPRPNTANVLFPELSSVKSVFKVLTTSARVYADFGDNQQSLDLMLLSVKLNKRLFSDGGVVINYLVSIACEAITMRSVDLVCCKSTFPIEDCRIILKALDPAPTTDTYAREAMRTDFQCCALKVLAEDPRAKESQYASLVQMDSNDESNHDSFVGNYDSIETGKVWAKDVVGQMSNALKPLTSYDDSFDRFLDRDGATLPKEPDPEKTDEFGKWWGKLRFRFLMNNTHNTVGRVMVDSNMLGRYMLQASARWRSVRDESRVLLASRIYRKEHGGRLPASIEAFEPILGAWPQDPFNGKKMLYLPKKEVVYTVGNNLVDDEGDVGINPSRGNDVGVTLKLDVPELVSVPLPMPPPSRPGSGD